MVGADSYTFLSCIISVVLRIRGAASDAHMCRWIAVVQLRRWT